MACLSLGAGVPAPLKQGKSEEVNWELGSTPFLCLLPLPPLTEGVSSAQGTCVEAEILLELHKKGSVIDRCLPPSLHLRSQTGSTIFKDYNQMHEMPKTKKVVVPEDSEGS